MGGNAVRRDIVDKENVVRACALRAVRRAGDQGDIGLAGLAQRHSGGAAAVQTDCADAAEAEQLLPELGGGQSGARGLVAVDLIQDDRAVRLDADRAARAVGRAAVNAGGGDRAVVDQQLAADRIIHLRPVAVACAHGECDLFADLEIRPGGDVRAVRLGQHHLVFPDGKRAVTRALADDLQLDRAVDRDRGAIHALEDDIGTVCGEMRRIVIVAVEQVSARRGAGLVEIGDRNRAALSGNRHAHRRAAHDGRAVRLEADRILPCVGRDQLALVDDQADRHTGRHDEKVRIGAADDRLALVFEVVHRIHDGRVAAVQLFIRIHHDGRHAGVRLIGQDIGLLQPGAVLALGPGVGQALTDRIGIRKSVRERRPGSRCQELHRRERGRQQAAGSFCEMFHGPPRF